MAFKAQDETASGSSGSIVSPGAGSISALLNPGLVAEARRIELRTKRSLDSDTVGRFRSSFRGSGLTFAELREYEPGDEVRRIDWKATVRTGRTYVKSYLEERTLEILLAVDCSRSTAFGAPRSRHRRALEFAALVTLLARQSGDAVGLLRFSSGIDQFIPPGRKRSQAHRIVTSLVAEFSLGAPTDLRKALDFTRQSLRRRTIVFVISDFHAPQFSDELKFLALKHDVICVNLADRPGQVIPDAGIVEFADAESGERLTVDTGSARGREALKTYMTNRSRNLRELCVRSAADYIELAEHPLQPLVELMNRRAKRMR